MKAVASTFWLFLLMMFFLLRPTAGTADTLKVAFAHWPPWKIIEGNHIQGIDANIVRAIGKRIDVTINFISCPWPRCIEMVKNGDADLITSFGKTASRETFVYYLGPSYIIDQVAFYMRKDKALAIKQYSDLHGKTIGTTKGASYFSKFDDDGMLNKIQVNAEKQLFQMLSTSRIDLFIGFETVIDYLLLKEGLQGRFKKSSFKVPSTGSHIAISKRSKALHRRMEISMLVAQMTAQGEIDRIIDDFFKMLHTEQNRRQKIGAP